MGDGFAGCHDQILVVDLALEKGSERVDGPARLATDRLEFLQTFEMFVDQVVKPVMRAAKRLAVGRQYEHVVRHPGFQVVERFQPVPERIGLGLRREYADVRRDCRQQLIAGDQDIRFRGIQAGMLG